MFNHTMALLLSLMVSGTSDTSSSHPDKGPLQRTNKATQWTNPPSQKVNVRQSILTGIAAATQAGQTPIVYVGAKWCEPCLRFKKAFKSGRLKRELSQLHVLEYDLDIHRQGLEAARYQSRMIPLFCIPEPTTGESTGRCFEGSIKGPGAVGNIVPRLRKLLGQESVIEENNNR